MEFHPSTASFGILSTIDGPQKFGPGQGSWSSASGRYGKFDCEPMGTIAQDRFETTSKDFDVVIKSFVSSGGVVEFKHPIQAKGNVEGSDYEIEFPELGILEFGTSYSECLRNFIEALTFRWDEYALESDEHLSPRALALAKHFRSLAKD